MKYPAQHDMYNQTYYNTYILVLRFYLERKISGLRWESNPQPSQLWRDVVPAELSSSWEQGSGE